MFKNKKVEESKITGKLVKSKLRMLRSEQAFEASPANVEGTDQERFGGDTLKDIRNAMVEADCQKAKALMAFQNNRRFC